VALPPWSWSYVTFRAGDGISSSLIPLAVVLHYHLPLWGLAFATAAQNLAGVPAAFLWGRLMDRGIRRRPVVVAGFAVAGGGLALMASLPSIPLFVLGAVLYTVFGVATAPAASTMVLQRVPRRDWSKATGALSRRTGSAYVLGMIASILLTLPAGAWLKMGDLGGWLVAQGLVGHPHFAGQFAASAVLAGGAALVAWQNVPPYQPPLPHEPAFDPKLAQATQRRFERAVFFPGRFRSIPSREELAAWIRSPHRLWPLGVALTFTGSVCFFSSYPGVLDGLGLAPGLVLLAQLPSNLVTPIAYPWAGRHGHRIGEARGVLQGSLLRTATLPVFCAVTLFVGAPAFWFLLLLHGVMGLSFSLVQVNAPVILAGVHPGGHGQGVGTYHAAYGAGTLLGSLSASLILAVSTPGASYLFAVAVAVAGMLCILEAVHRTPSEASPPPAGPAVG
jgi:MFS family permease